MNDTTWQEGHRLLQDRLAALSEAVRSTAAAQDPPLDLRAARRVVTTGIGSSEAHARFLAHLLEEHAGLNARYLPVSAVVAPDLVTASDALVVFSQGLSPNAQLVIGQSARWRQVVAATAVTVPHRLAPLTERGVRVVHFAGEDEYGTLVRIIGPFCAYLCALRLARTAGAPLSVDLDAILAALVRAPQAVAAVTPAILEAPLAFVTSGGYSELVVNLQRKILEGTLRGLPPVWDVLDIAHGPFQQVFSERATFLALARADAPDEPALFARLETLLDPALHTVVRLQATLPGPLAVLEHEAQLNALLLADIAARGVDQVRWPGRGRDGALYDVGSAPVTRQLGACTWPEVEALIARRRTAVLALGSTEQHGPHLPLDTDTIIGDALAERFCTVVDEAVACPTLTVGCASEHLGFPGTLHAEPATLTALVRDVVSSLGRHGILRVFVFSAHGGNVEALREALPRLRAACAPVEILAFTDLDRLTDLLHEEALAGEIPVEAAGHHAGEIETSIMLALRPGVVRTAAMEAGTLAPGTDAQPLFYPDLRTNAPTGVVGDPRRADAARGARYLRAWVTLLVRAYRRSKDAA